LKKLKSFKIFLIWTFFYYLSYDKFWQGTSFSNILNVPCMYKHKKWHTKTPIPTYHSSLKKSVPLPKKWKWCLAPVTDVMIFSIFSPKKAAKKLAFLTQNKAQLCKIFIIRWVFEKIDNFSTKIVKNHR
jgi:hypothetical protein